MMSLKFDFVAVDYGFGKKTRIKIPSASIKSAWAARNSEKETNGVFFLSEDLPASLTEYDVMYLRPFDNKLPVVDAYPDGYFLGLGGDAFLAYWKVTA